MSKNFFIILVILFSCKKSEQEKWFEAKVISTADPICGVPVVKFLEKDSLEICSITRFNTLSYRTYSLNGNFNYLDNIVMVKIGKFPEAWQGPPCSGVGTLYYDIWFSFVKQK